MKTSVDQHSAHFRAVGLAVVAYTCWVLADTSIKIAGATTLPSYQVMALVGFAMVALQLIWALLRGQLRRLWPTNPARQFLRSCLDVANMLCVVIALRHLPLALFYILVFSAPMLTTLLEALLLHEPLEWRRGLAVLTGFIGVVIAADPFHAIRSGAHSGYRIGYLACMVCVSAFSLNMVWSRKLTQTESPESLAFSSGALMALVGGIAMLFHATPLSLGMASVLLVSGASCVVGSLCFFVALRHAAAAMVSQYHYTQLLTGALIAWFIWHEELTHKMLLGAILIIGAGWYTAARSYQSRDGAAQAVRSF